MKEKKKIGEAYQHFLFWSYFHTQQMNRDSFEMFYHFIVVLSQMRPPPII